MGERILHALGIELSDTKNKKNKIYLAFDGGCQLTVHTTTNQKHVGVAVYIGEEVGLGGSVQGI